MKTFKSMSEKEKYEFLHNYDKLSDEYGNNTNFPDEIVSQISIKGLLGKWTQHINYRIIYALKKYHMKTRNIDYGDVIFTKCLFEATFSEINYLTPILEDLTGEHIYGMEDIFIAVFGIQSDEIYSLRAFLKLYARIDNWDEDLMWTDCRLDSRLKSILEKY